MDLVNWFIFFLLLICNHSILFSVMHIGGDAVANILARRKHLQDEESDSQSDDGDW